MREFQNETERAVWAAAFANGKNTWTAQTAADHADYVVDRLRELMKARGRQLHEVEGKKLLDEAARAVRKLAALRPPNPDPGKCGDQSRLFYDQLAAALEDWGKKL